MSSWNTGLSPVIAAFLGGQQQQQSMLEQANQLVNQKEELKQRRQAQEDLMSRFREENALEQKKFGLQQEVEHRQYQMALWQAEQDIGHQLFTGERPQTGTSTPGQMDIPGLPAGQPLQDEMNSLAPSKFTPNPTQTVSTPMGDVTVPQGKTQQQLKEENAMAMVPAIKAQSAATAEGALPSKMKEIQANNDTKMAVMESKIDSLNQIATDRNASNEKIQAAHDQVRELTAQLDMFKILSSMGMDIGLVNPEDRKNAIDNLKNQMTLGQIDMNKANPLHKEAANQLASEGKVPLSTKTKADITTQAGQANRLFNDSMLLDSQYPAASSIGGRTMNRAAGFFNNTTDIGQKFSEFNSNIASFAKITGETASMARSVFLAKKAEAAKIGTGDTPEVRRDKLYRKIPDLGLERLQDSLSNLPVQQRIANWKDLFNTSQFLITLKKDARYTKVLENIIKTGNYDPNLMNNVGTK